MMRRTTALCTTTPAHTLLAHTLLAFTLLAFTLLSPAPAGAAAETCGGLPATIVAADGDVTGTEGPDVVVVTGPAEVALRGGDDLVCVAGDGPAQGGGSPSDPASAIIDAGPGDDVVDTTAANGRPAAVTLGAGADRFAGGPGREDVTAGDWGGPGWTHQDSETDVMLGGGGDDAFVSGASGQPNADTIDLGQGDDRLEHDGMRAADGSITGGGGEDLLLLPMIGSAAVADNTAGRFVDQGRVTATWTGIEEFYVRIADDSERDLTFLGNESDETLTSYGETVRLTARFGGGNDTLHTTGLLGDGSAVDGGAGRDLFDAAVRDRTPFSLDLRSGELRKTEDPAYAAAVTGIEDATLLGGDVVLRGTNGRDRLKVAACTGSVTARGGADTVTLPDKLHSLGSCGPRLFRLDGGAGDDRLTGSGRNDRLTGGAGDDTLVGNGGPDRLLGGSGDDRLLGRSGRDVLVGGSGRDTATGGPGRDRCATESRRECER